jgi:hypothetical protein
MNTKDRNYLLLQLFKKNGFKAVRLIGNPNTPAVILFENLVLNCHCREDIVYFTDKPKSGNIIWEVDLNGPMDNMRPIILNILELYDHRKLYRIELKGGDLLEPLRKFYKEGRIYLKDYYYSHEEKAKFPVFIPGKDVKLYFEKDKALEAVQKILNVTPELTLEVV